MAFTEDKSVFFDTSGGFAVAAVYNGAVDVNGILDEDHVDVSDGYSAAVAINRKTFTCDADDIASPAAGVSLVIGADTYTVREYEIDNGLLRLILEAT